MSRVPIPPGNIEFEYKEQLYALFYELTSEIKGKDIELEEDNYINSINSIELPQLINYLRDTIHILINQQNNTGNQLPSNYSSLIDNNECLQYDSIIQHLEANERLLIRKHFELIAIKEILEIKLIEHMKIEKEFRELKDKVKYEEGRFLKNERKDNEIIIIRTENTILKKTIAELEEKRSKQEKENSERDMIIKQLNKSIKEQMNEIDQLRKDMKICSNININVNNLSNKCSHCGGKYNDNYNTNVNSSSKSPERTPRDRNQFELFNMKKISTQKLSKKIQYNPNLMNKSTTNKNMIDLTSTSKINQYQHNSSMNMMILDMTQKDNGANLNWNINKTSKISPFCMKIPATNLSGSGLSSKRKLSSRISLSKKPTTGAVFLNQINNNKSYLGTPYFIRK